MLDTTQFKLRLIRKNIQRSPSVGKPSGLIEGQGVQVKGEISFVPPHIRGFRKLTGQTKFLARSTGHFFGYRGAIWKGLAMCALIVGVFIATQLSGAGALGTHQANIQAVRFQEVAPAEKNSLSTAHLASPSLLYVGGIAHTLQLYNDRDPNYIGVGGSTPEPSLPVVHEGAVLATSPPLTTAAAANTRKDIITYIVQEGDNPSVVAASFGITLNTLLWANDLKDGQYIHPGDELVILPIPGVRYKVRSGDTLSTIASTFRGDIQEIIAFNGLLEDGPIYPGNYLVIPDGEMPKRVYSPPYSYAYAGKDLGGYFIRPASGRISQGIHLKNAVDIANACWTPVYAAAEGEVLIADGYGWNGGYGQYVHIRHPNGVETLYAHSIKLAVRSGQYVTQGQLIAYMGSTGISSGCHVHWEVLGARNPLG